MNADRLTDEQVKQLWRKASRDFNEDRDQSPVHLFARAIESAARSEYDDLLRQAREALTPDDVKAIRDIASEYESLARRWKDSRPYSQESANLNETYKARERSLGRLAGEGLFARLTAALATLDARLGEQKETGGAYPQRNEGKA